MKKTLLFIMLGFWGLSLFAQTTFETSFKELPKDAQKYITKTYAGWTVDKCIQEDNAKQKMTSCDVFVSKGTEKLKLIFDKDGEFVKKEIIPEPAKAAPTPAAVVAPTLTPVDTPVVVPAATPAPVAAPVAEPAKDVAPVAPAAAPAPPKAAPAKPVEPDKK
jgi:hypothetical protein